MFELQDVCKVYEMKGVETHALRGATLEIRKGEYVAILGPSGSGKSTLMHIMGCLDTPTKGGVFVEGRKVSEMNDDELARIRREKIGFVFQAYNLIPGLTAIENVALPLRLGGHGRGESQRKAKEVLRKVGLGERTTHKPNELSGGEQQRVAIARSLINDPDAILADEPTGNLDTKSGKEIFELLENLHKKTGKTIIVVTHDINLAKRAHREIRIMDGKIVN
ncbi:MAG: ATP-binding cassette domain-containing protein [Candidatus Aenigmarchaeota archaeon]|nr:ATP-binding cassette domain-containing protein [Candidatus Aenigmarchaeota archaeon]NIP40325.1 ATP-binding cassette domain-containing protein [Candidatus Aenigmarchaeota archaeon]NIQ17819.1 ATP-binding cassette domain-containing protein [Candidatus Aenigmarchaeota archaeon]NIS73200.1 ATP-binding cassette domain-containing protein [Candidatus Aenigmarchaeota archaeon]